jgi:hypothetical protein
MNDDADGSSASSRARHIVKRLGARKMEFIATAVICTQENCGFS